MLNIELHMVEQCYVEAMKTHRHPFVLSMVVIASLPFTFPHTLCEVEASITNKQRISTCLGRRK